MLRQRMLLHPGRSLVLAGLALVLVVGSGSVVPARAEAGPEVGRVVAVEGRALAAAPGSPARVLVCGDPVHADERISTEPGARLVLARDAQHVHVGPASVVIVRRGAGGRQLVLVHGEARLLDGRELPSSRIATAAGVLPLAGADLEIRRLASGALEVCDWASDAQPLCQRIEPQGQIHRSAQSGPRLDLGMRGACPWVEREPVALADIASPPPVASGLDSIFEPEFDPDEPGCQGDECTQPEIGPPTGIVYTVAPPIVFLP